MLTYLSTSFEIQRYYQKQPKFNAAYSRNNLPKLRNGVYIINLDENDRNLVDSLLLE